MIQGHDCFTIVSLRVVVRFSMFRAIRFGNDSRFVKHIFTRTMRRIESPFQKSMERVLDGCSEHRNARDWIS